MLRSFRLGEADRVLHLYTLDRGRVGAVAKGVRKTTSRFGARLEPLSHAELLLHQGVGRAAHGHRRPARARAPGRPRGLLPALGRADRCGGDAPALQRAGTERARVHRADALPRPPGRGAARSRPARTRPARALVPAQAAVAVGLPAAPDELRRVRPPTTRRSSATRRVPAARSARPAPGRRRRSRSAPDGVAGIETLLAHPLADAAPLGLSERARRDALRVVTASYEYHGGFRLRTLSA